MLVQGMQKRLQQYYNEIYFTVFHFVVNIT